MANVTLTAQLKGFEAVGKALDGTASRLKRISISAGNVSKKLASAGSSMRAFGKSASLFVSAPLLGAGVAAVKFASDLDESFNKASVTFGEASKAVLQFSETSATSFGIAKSDALEYSATLGVIMQASGITADASADMSVQMVQLAADLASFNNIPIDAALEKIRAGLVGEAEPLRTVGVLLSEAAVQAKAMELGLVSSKAEITDQIKVQARYAIIMEQTKTAQGDFARTSDSLANSVRIARAELKDAAAELGTQLLPVAQRMVQIARDLVKRFTEMSPEAKRLAIGIAGLVAVVGPLAVGVGGLVTAFASLLGAINPVTLAILAGVAAMTVGGLAAIGFASDAAGVANVIANLGEILKGETTAAEAFAKGHSRVMTGIEIAAKQSLKVAKAKVTELAKELGEVLVSKLESTKKAFDEAGDEAEEFGSKAGAAMERLRKAITQEPPHFEFKITGLGGEKGGAAGGLTKAMDSLRSKALVTWETINADGIEKFGNLEDVATETLAAMADVDPASKQFDEYGNIIDKIVAKMHTVDTAAAEAFSSMAQEAIDNMRRVEEPAISAFDRIKDAMGEWAEESAVTLATWGDLAQSTFDQFKQGVGDAVAEAIIEGENLAQSMENVLKNVAKSVISTLVQIAIQQLVNLAVSLLTSTAQASTQGATSIALAGSNAYASTAAIPIIGPALAPAAATAAIAGATAAFQAGAAAGKAQGATIGAAAGGMENVPATGTFLLHRGEAVLQREQNQDLRDFLARGGVTGDSVNITFAGPVNFSDAIQKKKTIKDLERGLVRAQRRRAR